MKMIYHKMPALDGDEEVKLEPEEIVTERIRLNP